MSTQPTEPGNYHWKFCQTDYTWEVVTVHNVYPESGNAALFFMRAGITRRCPLEHGVWGPRIPAPDEPRAEPTGGLTVEEIGRLKNILERHKFAPAIIESVATAELARMGFMRLTDAEITAGVKAADWEEYQHKHRKNSDVPVMEKAWADAFRLAVAKLREAGK